MGDKKPKYKTVENYKRWRNAKYAFNAGVFLAPTLPAGVITAINWQEWFENSGISLPLGFSTLLLSVVFAVVAILNSDTVLKKTDIALYCLGGLFMCIGLTCMFLASLFTQMGWLWLSVGIGLLGSGTSYLLEQKLVEPNLQMYKKLMQENCLDAKSQRLAKKQKQAEKEAKEDAKLQAVD